MIIGVERFPKNIDVSRNVFLNLLNKRIETDFVLSIWNEIIKFVKKSLLISEYKSQRNPIFPLWFIFLKHIGTILKKKVKPNQRFDRFFLSPFIT